MIESFADADTELLWNTGKSRRIPANIRSTALKQFRILGRAHRPTDLNSPSGNRLEALSDGRKGQYSIRINDQFRLCFRWSKGNAFDVEIVDYR